MQTSKNELKLGVLYKVESPIVFYHVHPLNSSLKISPA